MIGGEQPQLQRSVIPEVNEMLRREFVEQVKQPPKLTGDDLRQLLGVVPAAGMAKEFKAGASTLRDLINFMIRHDELLPSRTRLIPAIRVPQTGEVFEGVLGELHPWELVIQALTKRKMPVGELMYGYKLPGHDVFIPEALTDLMRSPDGLRRLSSLLDRFKVELLLDIIDQAGGVFPK